MFDAPHPFWDSLSGAELEYTDSAVAGLEGCEWARALLNHARLRGSLPDQVRKVHAPTAENLSDLFELRFGYELVRSGVVAQYEFAAGVGDSTVDFYVPGPPGWLIELVCLRTTQAIKATTSEYEVVPGVQMYQQILTSDSSNKGNSLQEEMIAAEGKIAEKVFSAGNATKFPLPGDAYHVIVADMRGFGGAGGGEWYEYVQMSVGVSALSEEERNFALCLPGTRRPIKGLFEPSCPLSGAKAVRERIHLLGFVAEKEYNEAGISRSLLLVNNPFLFSDANAVRSAYKVFPLNGVRKYSPVVLPV